MAVDAGPQLPREPASDPRGVPNGKAALVEQAYEEFCRLQEEGEAVDSDAFCARFPGAKSSLARLLRAHRYLEGNPDLLHPPPVCWPEAGQEFLGFTLLRELGRGAL